MSRNIYEIADQARDLRKKIHRDLEDKEALSHGKIAEWGMEVAEMLETTAAKVDELFERLVRLEDEMRGGKGPQKKSTVLSDTFIKKRK